MTLPYRTGLPESIGYDEIQSFYYPRGPIKRIISYFHAAGALPLYTGNSEYLDFDSIARRIIGRGSFQSTVQNTIFGGGKGADLPSMVASSLGEVIERALGSFMGFAHDTLIHYGTYDTLVARGYKCFPPDELPLFVESQYKEAKFPYKPFTRDTFVGWVKGAKLLDGEEVWLPAQIVLPFYLSHPEEPLICYATSGGLAAHISRERAIEHGLAEVFERDAVNLHWNCGHAPRPIVLDCEPRDPRLRRVFDNARSLKTDVRLYLHETDIPGLHTVTAVGFIAGFNKFAYVAGGGGGLSIDAAILGALGEYSQAESANRIVLCAPQWRYSDRVDELLGVDEETPVEDFDIFYKVIGH